MPTCAIYARVSDESQVKGDSISHQVSLCREYARRRNLESVGKWETPESLVYIDEGITGTSMVKRPAIQALRDDARKRKFDVVLFKGISRFARDTVDSLLLLRTLTSSGIRVISMEENFDSERDNAEFVFTIHSALAQAESEKTAIRVRVGILEKAKTGRWNGRPPDGYLLNPTTKKLELDDAFAPVIRQVYERYLSGVGCRAIADALNHAGQYTKRGFYWSHRAVANLLRNPAYVGDVVYGRQEKNLVVSDDSSMLARRRKASRVRDPSQIVVCRDAHPAIVDRAMFERVQAMMSHRKTDVGRTGKLHLLTRGILKCTCGSHMTIKYNVRGTSYYRCLGQHAKGRGYCQQRYIRTDAIENAILSQIQSDVARMLAVHSVQVRESTIRRTDEWVKGIQKQLNKQLEKSQILFDRYTDGVLLEAQFLQMNEIIQKRIVELEGTLTSHSSLNRDDEERTKVVNVVEAALRNNLSIQSNNKKLTRKIVELLVKEVNLLHSQGGTIGVSIHYRFSQT